MDATFQVTLMSDVSIYESSCPNLVYGIAGSAGSAYYRGGKENRFIAGAGHRRPSLFISPCILKVRPSGK